ncbi:MAG: Ribosomal RNA large subunit methyltransferase E [Promethearchaeota archaeon]|nr:MAG: Ribosomal RNA large subunit methyltransferase E [Candidatus Lokiarchaeota archaeon]
MGSSERHRREKFYKKAKEEGYRARSAYKLIGIQKKFNIFKRAFYILDLGAAPGSWLQVARKYAQENLQKYDDKYYHRDEFKIMGVDKKRIRDIEDVKTIKMDFTTKAFEEELKAYFDDKLDLVLSDASIKKSGNKFSDHIKQIRLCYKIVDLLEKYLQPKGAFVIKSFQGTDFKKFYDSVKHKFRYVKAYKPKASKKKSNEIYVVGK